MKKVLGLDLSFTSTGYYLLKDEPIFGTIVTKPKDFDNDISRVDLITDKVMSIIQENEPELIMMEDYYIGRNAFSVIKLVTLGSIMRFKILKSGRSFMTIAPSQLKKFQTGNGNAKKDNMILSVYKKQGFETNSNDMADACAIAYFANAYLKYTSEDVAGFCKYELDVLKDFCKKHEKVTL